MKSVIDSIAKLANCHPAFVTQLPDGFKAPAPDGGVFFYNQEGKGVAHQAPLGSISSEPKGRYRQLKTEPETAPPLQDLADEHESMGATGSVEFEAQPADIIDGWVNDFMNRFLLQPRGTITTRLLDYDAARDVLYSLFSSISRASYELGDFAGENNGYAEGYSDGRDAGIENSKQGFRDARTETYLDGYSDGRRDTLERLLSEKSAKHDGTQHSDDYNRGFEQGFKAGRMAGRDPSPEYDKGFEVGHRMGLEQAEAQAKVKLESIRKEAEKSGLAKGLEDVKEQVAKARIEAYGEGYKQGYKEAPDGLRAHKAFEDVIRAALETLDHSLPL